MEQQNCLKNNNKAGRNIFKKLINLSFQNTFTLHIFLIFISPINSLVTIEFTWQSVIPWLERKSTFNGSKKSRSRLFPVSGEEDSIELPRRCVMPFDFTSHRSPRRKQEGSVNRKSYRGWSGWFTRRVPVSMLPGISAVPLILAPNDTAKFAITVLISLG